MSKQQLGSSPPHPMAAAQLRQIEPPGTSLTSSGATEEAAAHEEEGIQLLVKLRQYINFGF